MTSPLPVHYPYATGALLDARNTYSYTAFHGADFLAAWSRHRDALLQPSADTAVAAPRAGKLLPPRPTELLLSRVRSGLAGDARGQALASLNHVLQRFEVTKRIHGEYNTNWRPADLQDYNDLDLYVQFAQTLDEAYGVTRGLQYLNGLLKCLDTLTAYMPALSSEQIENLQTLVRSERSHVDALRRALDERAA